MTFTHNKIKATAAILALTATLFTSAPAYAGEQNDVQLCRVAMATQSNIDMNDYRLRFERSKGFRARTVYLKAIPIKGGQSFRFSCHLNRTHVLALRQADKNTRLAFAK